MKSLTVVIVAAGFLGAFALSGCSSCDKDEEDTTTKTTPPVTCGPNAVVSGTECVGPVQ